MVVQVLGQQDLLLFMALNKSLAQQKKTVACVLQHVQQTTLLEQPGLIGAVWCLNYSPGRTWFHQHPQKTNSTMHKKYRKCSVSAQSVQAYSCSSHCGMKMSSDDHVHPQESSENLTLQDNR